MFSSLFFFLFNMLSEENEDHEAQINKLINNSLSYEIMFSSTLKLDNFSSTFFACDFFIFICFI
jgi:hypothetical protein